MSNGSISQKGSENRGTVVFNQDGNKDRSVNNDSADSCEWVITKRGLSVLLNNTDKKSDLEEPHNPVTLWVPPIEIIFSIRAEKGKLLPEFIKDIPDNP